MQKTQFIEVDFIGADLKDANFSEANLNEALPVLGAFLDEEKRCFHEITYKNLFLSYIYWAAHPGKEYI